MQQLDGNLNYLRFPIPKLEIFARRVNMEQENYLQGSSAANKRFAIGGVSCSADSLW